MASGPTEASGEARGPERTTGTFDHLGAERALSRPRSFAAFLLVWVICALALVLPTVWWAGHSWQIAEANATADVKQTTRSAAEFVDNTLGLIDVILKRLSEAPADKTLSSTSIDELCPSLICSDNRLLTPFLYLVFARDDGSIITFGPNVPRLNVVDHDYFRAQKEEDSGLYVGAVRHTPFMKADALPMSRRLTSKSGAFDGIVAALVDIALIRTVFQGLGHGKADRISLLNVHGQQLVSWSAEADVPSPKGGKPTAPCDTSGMLRSSTAFAATMDVGIGNLSVLACRSMAQTLKPWRQQVGFVVLGEMLLLLAPILAFPTIKRRAKRRFQQHQGMQELVAGSSDFQFIIAVRADGTFVLEALRFSREGDRGPAAASLVGRTLEQLFSSENAAQIEADYLAVFKAAKTRRIERRIVMEGTELVWSTLLVPLIDAGGRSGYIYGAATDMTEGRKLESRLMRFVEGSLRHEDDERRRIARELHDTTGQNLISAQFELDKVADAVAGLLPSIRDSLAQAQAKLDGSIAELRTLSYVLYPALLDEAGLGLAIKTLSEGFERRTSIPVDVVIYDDLNDCRWAPEVELALYRVVQEALTNVQRHSSANEVSVSLSKKATGNLELVVEDKVPTEGDGALAAPIAEGAGIRGMRDRLESLGGKLVVQRLENGIRVTANVPAHMVVEGRAAV